MKRRILVTIAAFGLATFNTLAQTPGDTPIRIVLPLGPGTPTDSATRIVAAGLSDVLKRTIIVDNKPGANGLLAVQELMRSKPDGTTLMLGGVSPVAINMAIVKNLPYDSRRDFTPIGGIYKAYQAYIVNNSLPVNTLPELIAHAKKNPGKIKAGYYSALTQIQLVAMNNTAGMDMLLVPYKTTSNTYTDLMGGVLDLTVADMATAMSFVKSGKARMLAITLSERSSLAPNLQTVSETIPGFVFPAWSGLVGPAGMPRDVVARLNSALNTVLNRKDTVGRLAEGASDPWPTTPEDFGKYIGSEVARWTKLARDAGIQPE